MSNTYTTTRFDNLLGMARTHMTEFKANVQELLIIACYFALKDGNTTPLNTILDMAQNGKSIDIDRITRWVENHSQVAFIKKGVFTLNKKTREAQVVTDEASFAPVEKHLREMAWYDSMPKQIAKSVFDLEEKAEAFIKQLLKHQHDPDVPHKTEAFDTMVKAIRQAKGEIALLMIKDAE